MVRTDMTRIGGNKSNRIARGDWVRRRIYGWIGWQMRDMT